MSVPTVPAAHLLFDRPLARARLARARRQGGADFLLVRAADDLADRVASVLRDFPVALDLGTPGPHLSDRLAKDTRITTLVRAAPLHEPRGSDGRLLIIADDEMLPFDARSFDLVTSALSLHQVNDLMGALIQIRRVLMAEGLFIGCLVGGASLHELRAAFATAEADIDGGASPRVSPFARVPDMVTLLQRAGFEMPVVDVDTITIRYADMFGLLRDLRAMGATNVLRERRRIPLKRSVLTRAAEVYAEHFAAADGRIPATFELIWLSGWGPRKPAA